MHIFDGDYGCEELAPGARPKVSVTLENENGEQKYKSVEDKVFHNCTHIFLLYDDEQAGEKDDTVQ